MVNLFFFNNFTDKLTFSKNQSGRNVSSDFYRISARNFTLQTYVQSGPSIIIYHILFRSTSDLAAVREFVKSILRVS